MKTRFKHQVLISLIEQHFALKSICSQSIYILPCSVESLWSDLGIRVSLGKELFEERGSSLLKARVWIRHIYTKPKQTLIWFPCGRSQGTWGAAYMHLIFKKLIGQNSGGEALSGILTREVDRCWPLVKTGPPEQPYWGGNVERTVPGTADDIEVYLASKAFTI